MTKLGLEYLKYKEDVRSNMAKEAENYRSNLARETETARSNLAQEAETNRHNTVYEQETARSNLAKEAETNRHNMIGEVETHRHNEADELHRTIRSSIAQLPTGLREAVATAVMLDTLGEKSTSPIIEKAAEVIGEDVAKPLEKVVDAVREAARYLTDNPEDASNPQLSDVINNIDKASGGAITEWNQRVEDFDSKAYAGVDAFIAWLNETFGSDFRAIAPANKGKSSSELFDLWLDPLKKVFK